MFKKGDRVRFNGNKGFMPGNFRDWFFDEEMEVVRVDSLVRLRRVDQISNAEEACIPDRLVIVESYKDRMRREFEEIKSSL